MKVRLRCMVLIDVAICNMILLGEITSGKATNNSCKVIPPGNNRADVVDIMKDCIPNGMLLSWNPAKDNEYNVVRFYSNNNSSRDDGNVVNCILFNFSNTDNKVSFNTTKGFEEDRQYFLQIQEFSGKDNIPKKTYDRNIGSCPWSGSWSQWSSWDSCSCQQDIYKPRTRTKNCRDVRNKMLILPNIQCQGFKNIQRESCYAECRPYLDSTTTTMPSPQPSTQSWGMDRLGFSVLAGGLALLVVLILCVIFIYAVKKTKFKIALLDKPNNLLQQTDTMETDDVSSIYVSHFQQTDRQESELLTLVQYISSFGLHCHVDLLSQVEINSMGGLPNWIPTKILDVKKIMVYLTKRYVEALKDFDGSNLLQGEEIDNNQVCKIHTEYAYIKTIIHHTTSLKESPKLVLILDRGVNYQDLPVEFQGLPFCYFPKRLKITADDNCRRLISMLKDIEPLQIVTEFTSRVDGSRSVSSKCYVIETAV